MVKAGVANKTETVSFIRFGSITGEKGENINRDKAYLFKFLALNYILTSRCNISRRDK